MRIVSRIFIILIILLSSCNRKNDLKSKISVSNLNTSYINYNADSVFYKLSVGYQNEEYYQDNKSNLVFLVTREVEVLDKNFGGFQKANLTEARNYSIKNSSKTDGQNVYLITKIAVKKKNGTYDNLWIYKNNIDFHPNDDGYSLYELKVFLEDSYAGYGSKVQNRLHINFKTVDYDNGYKLYTLNYIFEDNYWKLVSRERVCTIPNDINGEEIGYCMDTLNENCVKKSKKFILTNEHISHFTNIKCN